MEITYRSAPCPTCQHPREVVDGGSLRRIREDAGLSLRELAARGGLSVPYLSDVELNRRRATDRVLAVYDSIS